MPSNPEAPKPSVPSGEEETLFHTGADGPTSPDLSGEATPSRVQPDWVALAREQAGRTVGHFILGELRGRGGMGLVYQAYDPTLRRVVALKLVRNRDPQVLARFQREARAQARVDHPNVCKVYEVGELDGAPFIAMQFIEGGDLASLGKGLALEEKVRIITLAADALEAAHQAGLIHRDIKPSNIMLERHGEAWTPFVLDFGLAWEEDGAHLTIDNHVLGTPAYMAPEQALGRGGRVDARTDVYALGATFYFLLANRPPFKGDNAAQTLVALADTEAPNLHQLLPGLPLDLAIIVHKCLEKEPDRRYASARLLAQDLRRFTEGEPILARPPSLTYRLGKKVRKHKFASLTVGLVALLAVFGTGWSLRATLRALRQAELSRRFGDQVKDLEWSLRIAHLLPCHDLGRDLGRVRGVMEAIGRQMEAQPGVADAPGAYALGRGYLVLGQYAQAREHLLRAWALGARGPQVAEALGSALGELYRRGLEGSVREPRADARAALQAELVRRFRDPALEYIRLAGDQPYLKGLVAYYEGRNEDADRLARAALVEDPASFEALGLQGDAAFAQAEAAFDHGLFPDAERALARAAQAYGGALDIARSHPALYLAEARRCLLALRLASQRKGVLDEDLFRTTLRLLDRAMACHPGDPELQLGLAQAWSAWGEALLRKGQSPLEANGRALEAARGAALAEPGPGPLIVMATLMRSNAEYVRYHGGDPEAWLTQAAAAFRRAVQLEPGNTTALRGHLLLCFVASDDARRRGRDPQAIVEEGQVLAERLVEIQPGLASNHDWTGGLAGAQAEYLLDHGRDPGAWFQRSLASFEKALAINPQDQSLANNLGYYTARCAEWELKEGRPEGPGARRAVELARRALQLNPNSDLCYGTLALACRIRADRALREGRDPMPHLQEGLAACRKGEALDPTFYDNPLQAGLLGLLQVRWLLAMERSVRPERPPGPALTQALSQALADLARARVLNKPATWETEVALARGLLLEAEVHPERALSLQAKARRLLAAVARVDPDLEPLRALRAGPATPLTRFASVRRDQ